MLRTKVRQVVVACAAYLALVGSSAVARAQSSFSLTSAIPGDVFVYEGHRDNRERQFVDDYWSDVFAALKKTGLDADVMELIGSLVGEQQMAEVDRLKALGTKLIDGVDWGDLCGKESASAVRLAEPLIDGSNISMGPPDVVWLFKGEKEGAAKNFGGLVDILQAIAKEVNQKAQQEILSIERTQQGGARVAAVKYPIPEGMPFRYTLSLALRDDVIVVALGDKILDEVLSLLAGQGTKKPIGHTDRFTKAFAGMKEAEDHLAFFDMQALLAKIRPLVMKGIDAAASAQGHGVGGGGTKEPSPAAPMKALAERILGVFGMFDYEVTVGYTSGHTTHEECVVRLVDGAKRTPFYNVFGKSRAQADFARYLPQESVSFSVNTMLDLGELYGFILETIRTAGPDGVAALAQWDAIQQQSGFDVKRDLLSWLEGDTVVMTVDTGPSPDTVIMLKVADETIAKEKVDAALKFLSTTLQKMAAENPMLAMLAVRTSPAADERLPGFQNIMMGLSPKPAVVGVLDGHIIFGTSANAVALSLATAAGDHPNVTHNKSVMAEAVVPDGAFQSVSFTDTRNFGKDMAMAIGGVSMAGGMAMMAVPDPQAQKVLNKVLGMLAKVGPVMQKIDFYKSDAACTTFDGMAWHTRSVTNYRAPVKQVERGM